MPILPGPSVIGSKSLTHFVGRSFWQVISDGCTPSSFVGEPRLTAAFLTTSNRYARTTKGLLVGVLRAWPVLRGLSPCAWPAPPAGPQFSALPSLPVPAHR